MSIENFLSLFKPKVAKLARVILKDEAETPGTHDLWLGFPLTFSSGLLRSNAILNSLFDRLVAAVILALRKRQSPRLSKPIHLSNDIWWNIKQLMKICPKSA